MISEPACTFPVLQSERASSRERQRSGVARARASCQACHVMWRNEGKGSTNHLPPPPRFPPPSINCTRSEVFLLLLSPPLPVLPRQRPDFPDGNRISACSRDTASLSPDARSIRSIRQRRGSRSRDLKNPMINRNVDRCVTHWSNFQ